MRRTTLIAGLMLLAALPLAAQPTPYLTVGKHRVHPARILARYADASHAKSGADTLKALDLDIIRTFSLVPNLVVLEISGSTADALKSADPEAQLKALLDRIAALLDSGAFAYVEPDYIAQIDLRPNDAAFQDGRLWGLENTGQNGGTPGTDIDAVRAWDITTGSTNVVVAVVDTGIRYTHVDLATQMWVNPGEIPGNGLDDDGNGFVDDIHGINAITMTGDPMDDESHGTHCSGTIGAAANNGQPHVGVAWQVRLMGCKFLDSWGWGSWSDAVTAIDYAVANGARILSNSYGGYGYSQALFDAIAAAQAAGVLFVASAGNEALDSDLDPQYPASYDLNNIISVAAINRFNSISAFSNYGRTSVDLGAPGEEIFSSTAANDMSYEFYDGTSMAAPHVAGVAALLLARYPNASLSELRQRLLMTVDPMSDLQGITASGGRVNAYNALTATPDGILELMVSPSSGSILLQGSTEPIFVQVSDLFSVTGATVTGQISTGGTLTFNDNGQPPDAIAGDATYSANLQVPQGITSLVLTIVARAPGKTSATNVVNYTLVSRPPNDDFADAYKLPANGATVVGPNRYATMEPGEPLHHNISSVGASVWWDWSPNFTGSVILDTAGSDFDTVLAVYTGMSVSALTNVASVDDSPGRLQGHLILDVEKGTTYRVAVAGYNDAQGMVRLRCEPGGRPDTSAPAVIITAPTNGMVLQTNQITVRGTAYDPFPNSSGVAQVNVSVNGNSVIARGTTNWSARVLLDPGFNTIDAIGIDNAGNRSAPRRVTVDLRIISLVNDILVNALPLPLTNNTGTVTGNTTEATHEPDEPFHAGNQGARSLWWYFHAPSQGVLTLDTAGSSFDTLLAVYTGTRITNLVEVISNDDASPEVRFSKVSFGTSADETYRIAVDGYGGAYGSVSLNYVFRPVVLYHVTLDATEGGQVSPQEGDYESGTTVSLAAMPDLDHEFLGWRNAAGTIVSTENPWTVVISSDLALTGVFARRSFTDDFERGGFNPALSYQFNLPFSAAAWIVQTNESQGVYAARSARLGDSQMSRLGLQVNSAGGLASFDFKVSSEVHWDWLEFHLNGVRLERWSGEVDWQRHFFSLPTGTNTLEWRYTKDHVTSEGLDAAFLDNLDVPMASGAISATYLPSGEIQLKLLGQPGRSYIIEASSDLARWTPIATNDTPTDGVIQVIDRNAGSQPARFYRARAQ